MLIPLSRGRSVEYAVSCWLIIETGQTDSSSRQMRKANKWILVSEDHESAGL